VAREGIEFGVLDRQLAVGGQQLVIKGLSREYDGIYLPLHGAHQAHNAACAIAAVEAFLGAGQGGGSLEPELVREAMAKVTSPGRLEVVRRGPTILIDAAHNPGGATATAEAIAEEFDFDHLVGVIAAMRDKDVHGVLEAFEPVLNEVVVSRNSTLRAMPVEELAAIAVEVFGPDRVTTVERLADAIERAVALTEEAVSDPTLGGTGVLVTGSVVTAGEAGKLLRPPLTRGPRAAGAGACAADPPRRQGKSATEGQCHRGAVLLTWPSPDAPTPDALNVECGHPPASQPLRRAQALLSLIA